MPQHLRQWGRLSSLHAKLTTGDAGAPSMDKLQWVENASAEIDSGSLTLELRSVNNRYLDIQLRMPDELRSLEGALREAITGCVT